MASPLEIQHNLESVLDMLFDFHPFSLKLLRFSENYTFCAQNTETGEKRILRVSLPGYHNEEEMQGELLWMEEISRDTTLVLPRVFRGRDGNPVQKFVSPDKETYLCCQFSFLEGHTLSQLQGEALFQALEETGGILAALHKQAQTRDPEVPLARFSWDLDDLLGEHPRWGHWQDFEVLTKEQIVLLEAAAERIKERIQAFGKGRDRFGLIHADLHPSNLIQNGSTMQVFDFDDCGYGYYLYDIGCALVTYTEELEDAAAALLRGYAAKRPLSQAEAEEVNTFILLRRLVRLAWLASHGESDTAKTVSSEYVGQTCEMAQTFLQS